MSLCIFRGIVPVIVHTECIFYNKYVSIIILIWEHLSNHFFLNYLLLLLFLCVIPNFFCPFTARYTAILNFSNKVTPSHEAIRPRVTIMCHGPRPHNPNRFIRPGYPHAHQVSIFLRFTLINTLESVRQCLHSPHAIHDCPCHIALLPLAYSTHVFDLIKPKNVKL